MLTEIGLKNFKCFREMTRIPVSKINLFTGINGRGKSTALQALLLMRQSIEHNPYTHQIIFNGSCIELGSFDDVKNSAVSRNEAIELSFSFEKNADNVNLHYILIEDNEDDTVTKIAQFNGQGIIKSQQGSFQVIRQEREHNSYYTLRCNQRNYGHSFHNLLVSWQDRNVYELLENESDIFVFIFDNVDFTKTHYVSADRIGPRDFYAKQTLGEFLDVGRKGEYTANILSHKKNDVVYDQLYLPSGATHTIIDQTAAWLSAIFGGGKIDVKPLEANIVIMRLNSEDSLNLYKPVNVGFGYSYALPIVVSGLIAREGERLIVENPEAHLHPYAQAQIAKFLAKVSACGVQVFIESHSEHILNGLRIAVLDEIIKAEDLKILYFQRDEDNPIVDIPVQADGAIEHWPDGFFDQTDKDFTRLFGF